jgi:hypothetical protein
MADRDCYIVARLLPHQQDRVKVLAEESGLKVGEWVRLSVLQRLAGEDSAFLNLVRQCFAIRVLLLNILLYVGPSEPGLKPERLHEICQATDQLSDKHTRRVLACAMPVVEVAPRGPAAVRNRQVGARLTESQYQEVALAAQASQLTIAEWVRDTVVAQLSREEFLHIVTQQVHGLRMILDDAARLLTAGSAELDRGILSDLTKRTDPASIEPRPMPSNRRPSLPRGLNV